jgi:nucleotide-binding universal stress UspA family protein
MIMQRIQHLMVGLQNHPVDQGLIRYAGAVARLGTVRELRFVHVIPPANPSLEDHDHVLQSLKESVAQHMGAPIADLQCYFDVLKGPLVDRLLAYALEQESDLMLVGHGRGRAGRKSLARRLAMQAPCSVWMVPEGSPAKIRTILVPVDFSEASTDAFRVAAALAQRTGNPELLTLHVYFDDAVLAYDKDDTSLREQAQASLHQLVERAGTPPAAVRPLFEQSVNAAQTIMRMAETQGADLIVMSTRGRSQSAAVLLGSVTEDVIIETKIPLLAVKHFGAKLGLVRALLQAWERNSAGTHSN